MTTFSVVIPTYDRPRELARCLHALTRLDYPRESFEVIVVDDGSRVPVDATADGIGIRSVRQANAGPASARNTGARAAGGRFVAFTDDDCEPAPDWLTRLESSLSSGAAAVAGRSTNAVHASAFARAGQLLIDHLLRYYNRDRADARFGTSNNLAVDRAALLEAGGFDESFPCAAGEDRELMHRLRSLGHRIAYQPGAVVAHHHRHGFAAFWRQHYGYGRAAVRFRERAGKVDVEPLRFYRDLLRAPTARLSALLLLSQVANAAGFMDERLRTRRRRLSPSPRG